MLAQLLAYVLAYDAALLVWLNSSLSLPLLDGFFSWATHLGSVWVWIPLSVIILSYRRLLGRRLVAGLVAANALAFFLKDVFARARPYDVLQNIRVLDTDPFSSFPSGHAANAFMAAYILSASYPERSKYFYALALVVAFSRVYLGAHYPLDVLAGAVLGLAVGWTVVRRLVREKKEKRKQ